MNMTQERGSWLRTTHWDVFGCLNFRFKQNETDAQKILAYFWNKIDRHYFGNASHRKNLRVERMCFLHTGKTNTNFHFHFVANTPKLVNKYDFAHKLNRTWRFDVKEGGWFNYIWPARSQQAVCNYLLREFYKLGVDSFNTLGSYKNLN
jgi:hypothetical protein